jgi:hypothetical protein
VWCAKVHSFNLECGFILYKPRKIIVYDNNILEYYDPETKQKKGQINLNDVLAVELVNKEKWTITILGRVYKFKVNHLIKEFRRKHLAS